MIGTSYPILEKIAWAERTLSLFAAGLMSDGWISSGIARYRKAIEGTSRSMRETGVSRECMVCAVHEGGSCCGHGIEDRFDGVLLLINLLLGAKLPLKRLDPFWCWFLGEGGCTIPARHVICINYLCRRIHERIQPGLLRSLEGRIAEEADAGFDLEERIKKWLLKNTDAMSSI